MGKNVNQWRDNKGHIILWHSQRKIQAIETEKCSQSYPKIVNAKIIKNGVKRTRKHILTPILIFFSCCCCHHHRCQYNTERVWREYIFYRKIFTVVAVVYISVVSSVILFECACFECCWKRRQTRIVNTTVFNWFSCFVELLSNTIEIMRNHCCCLRFPSHFFHS